LSRRAIELVFVLVVALAEAVGTILIVVASNHEPHKLLAAALTCIVGLSFIFSGLLALHFRPDNRNGLYLAAVGYLWFFRAPYDANSSLAFTLGVMLSSVAFIPFAALISGFPSGRLDALGRRLVRLTVVLVFVVSPLSLLFTSKQPGCTDCPPSAFLVYDSPGLGGALGLVATIYTVGLIAYGCVMLGRRYRDATKPARRVLLPVYAAGGATLVTLLLANVLEQLSTGAVAVVGPIFLVFLASVPFAFLFGILRSRLARGSVGGLMVSLEHGEPLRAAIADALGDPSLGIAFWLEDANRWVDRDGRLLNLSLVPDQAITVVERDGRRIAALLHDESLSGEHELVESVSAAVAFALDNERLQTELRMQNERLLTVMRAAPSLLTTVGTDGRIRRLNPATVEASGFATAAEVEGRYFWDVFIDPGERRGMIARFRAAAPEHGPAEYENTFTNARGETRSIIWRGAPIHDETGAVESIVAAGLDVTEHRRQEEEIRASRGRIVAAGDQERRRLERNLHDGAQQRLVSLSLALRLAQVKLDTDPAAVPEILAGASDELALALEELRELARGIHPAVLTDRGLDAALEGLAARTPIAVEVEPVGRRLPEPIEAAAYYVVSEAVTNVVKHASATSVKVAVEAVNGHVAIEVADDGIGGADAASGSGLRGLADRLDALEGRLTVESEPGSGTRVLAEIPWRSQRPPTGGPVEGAWGNREVPPAELG
jgi:PAS domain S-box-containing protein